MSVEEIARTEPRTLAEEALRRSEDLLADFDRAFRVFQEFVGGCRALYDFLVTDSVAEAIEHIERITHGTR